MKTLADGWTCQLAYDTTLNRSGTTVSYIHIASTMSTKLSNTVMQSLGAIWASWLHGRIQNNKTTFEGQGSSAASIEVYVTVQCTSVASRYRT